MYKINFGDEKVFLNYLKGFENKYHKRQKVLNEILEINDKDDEALSYWDFTDNSIIYGQFFDKRYDKDTSLSNVSHYVKNIEKINGEYFAEIKILTTYWGIALLDLINAGIKFHLECVYHTYENKKIIRLDINDY
jgi:hypothetical protein